MLGYREGIQKNDLNVIAVILGKYWLSRRDQTGIICIQSKDERNSQAHVSLLNGGV
jgi:hypothetical protein